MKKAEAKEALEIYRKFLPVGDRVKGFLQVAKVLDLMCMYGYRRNITCDNVCITVILRYCTCY